MAERVAVIGTGYVGLVTGACLADLGHDVACVDVDPKRIDSLNQGQVPFREPGLDDVVGRAVRRGHLSFSTSTADAVQDASFAILAVGTPARPDGSADLTYINAAADDVAKNAKQGLVIVIRSTVPPGTGDGLAKRLVTTRPDLGVVNAPEFLAEGTAVRDFQTPDRLVFGGDRAAVQRVAALWDGVRPEAKRHLVDRPTAELAKYASNTFLAARVSLINEMANLCEAVGADVRQISTIVGEDSRIGPNFLRPGIGYGGSCFPKDVRAVAQVARSLGVQMPVAEAAEVTNEAQWELTLRKCLKLLGSPQGKSVGILGISFKPDTDDTRYAPGLRIAKGLREAGVAVRMHDPAAKLPADVTKTGVEQVAEPRLAVEGSDLVILATEWRAYSDLDWKSLHSVAKNPLIVDGRNSLPWNKLVQAGWSVHGVGVPKVTA